MSGFEWNKIAAGVLLAGLIAMVVGTVTDILYKPVITPEKRGYQVAGVEESSGKAGEGKEATPEVAVNIPELLAKASIDAGKEQAKKCSSCHNFEKNGANRVGPNLWEVVGAKKGHLAGFAYSQALLSKGGNWNYDDLYHFLNNPKKFMPGTKMGFAGFRKPEDIANTIAYLRSLSDSPVPLPTK